MREGFQIILSVLSLLVSILLILLLVSLRTLRPVPHLSLYRGLQCSTMPFFATCGLHILIIYWQTIISSYHKRKCLYEPLLKSFNHTAMMICTNVNTTSIRNAKSSFPTPSREIGVVRSRTLYHSKKYRIGSISSLLILVI